MYNDFPRERLLGLLLLLTLPAHLHGQATFGNIIGTVTDPGGSVIAGAKVTITSIERGTVQSTVTNDSGNYIQTPLDPGTYKVQIEAQGFQRMEFQEVPVS